MMDGSVAFSVDGMLTALPQITTNRNPETTNASEYIPVWFMIEMGVGTLLVGPLSYAFSRLKVIIIGLLFYIAMGLLAFVS